METTKPKKKPAKRVLDKRPEGEGKISCRARVWLDMDGETFIAPGRAALLERIAQYGSITKAARSMEMSYRHAWLLVDDMNRKAASPLVERMSGGKGGGGTKLTDEGKKVLEKFGELQSKFREFVKEMSQESDLLTR